VDSYPILAQIIKRFSLFDRERHTKALLHGHAYCVIVKSKGGNDENQKGADGFGDDSLLFDDCNHWSLWLVKKSMGMNKIADLNKGMFNP
jgi:hypothetical protein